MKFNNLFPLKALVFIMDYCKEKQLTFSIAESVTGGRVSSAFTALPGSSKVFKEGIVCYSPESKTIHLNIKSSFIQEYGLVSGEITLLMAKQIRKALKVDIGIATTGNAGPETNDMFSSVGQAYIAVSTKNNELLLPRQYSGPRNKIQSNITNDTIRTLYYFLMESGS